MSLRHQDFFRPFQASPLPTKSLASHPEISVDVVLISMNLGQAIY
jgi:hypothetical protein